jgi:hypothetical protein
MRKAIYYTLSIGTALLFAIGYKYVVAYLVLAVLFPILAIPLFLWLALPASYGRLPRR